jgi:TPR repeat protein
MRNLGLATEAGHGVKKDLDAAIVWYKKAAALGDYVAKEKLAELGK